MLRKTFVMAAAVAGLALMGPGRGSARSTPAPATPASAETFAMVVTREFDAPVERVWQAWIDADDVRRWWGPEGYTAPVADMDVREGGASLVCMRSPEGVTHCSTWTYEKIVPGESLAFTQRFADDAGNAVSPTDLGLPPEIPDEVPHLITFRALPDGRTGLTVAEYGYPVAWIVEVSAAGMNQCLDKMAALISAR